MGEADADGEKPAARAAAADVCREFSAPHARALVRRGDAASRIIVDQRQHRVR
jgi:hypothetical protein